MIPGRGVGVEDVESKASKGLLTCLGLALLELGSQGAFDLVKLIDVLACC